MILAVTLNLALDVTYRVRRLEPGKAHTLELVGSQAGGKGVNVSRILKQLGVPTLSLGLVGGISGEAVVEEMTRAGLAHRLVRVPEETRRCMAVVEDDGRVTEVNEQGPEVPPEAWDEFVEAFEKLLNTKDVRVTVLSGSLPPGLPVDAYAILCRTSHLAGIPVALDSSGDALVEGIKAQPEIVKPNRKELLEALKEDGISEPQRTEPFEPSRWVPVVYALRAKGPQAVVASFGADGVLAVTEQGAWFARPERVSGNPVGAGDAVTAALARAEAQGAKWPERIRDAAALSAAAVASTVAGSLNVSLYRDVLVETRLVSLPS